MSINYRLSSYRSINFDYPKFNTHHEKSNSAQLRRTGLKRYFVKGVDFPARKSSLI